MQRTETLKGKKVSVHADGHVFVEGRDTKLKVWKSDETRYSNLSGQEQRELKGKSLESALASKGFL